MPVYTIELSDDEQMQWEAYLADQRVGETGGIPSLAPPPNIPDVQTFIGHAIDAYRLLIADWWQQHPESRPHA